MRIVKFYLLTGLLVTSFVGLKAQFTEGNLVALRVGNINSVTGPVSLREFNTNGDSTFAVTIPSANTAAPNRMTISGTNAYEGQLTLSEDGRFLIFNGYNAPPFSGYGIYTTSSKVIGKVDYTGAVDLTNRIGADSAGLIVRSVVSRDGQSFWAASSNMGLRYLTVGDTIGTRINSGGYRSLNFYNAVLYASAAGIAKFAGVPTTFQGTTSTGTYNATYTANTQFVFVDADPNVGYNGSPYDVLYMGDGIGNNNNGEGFGINKYYVNAAGTAWVYAGIYDVSGAGLKFPALTAKVNALGQPVIYAIEGDTLNNSIISITDASGKANMSAATITVKTLASAGITGIFKGISFSPSKTALPLPLKFVSFTGSVVSGNALLNWVTTNETNVKSFSLEKSLDGVKFMAVGTVAAANNIAGDKYTYTDKLNEGKSNYYRLKVLDKNGGYSYSSVVVLKAGLDSKALGISPNPVIGNSITVKHPATTTTGDIILISTLDGKKIKEVVVAEGASQTSFDISSLHTGNYVLTFTDGKNRTSTEFVK
ncbi:T9SS type A sorting domain-containing protein [Parasediminibacterium sp. JCM 36343]|uniref:T9SS type A sorting domain-containing protein n=1 Tax=Parasediminibacterium sp. JCM 36343 TaxID=3374279 RepID=UPI00397C4E55